jgi:hypothetical protein
MRYCICKNCDSKYDFDLKVCPECGSKKRAKKVILKDEVFTEPTERQRELRIRSTKKMPKVEGRKRRREFELEKMDDISKLYGKIVDRQQIIDRKNNKGKEIITDKQTGEVLYEKEYYLLEHKGHGTEKVNKHKEEQAKILKKTKDDEER